MRTPCLSLCALLVAATAAATPISIVHQGRLLAADDSAVNEPQNLTISIHTLETDPSTEPPAPLWSRTYPNVVVQKGLYSVVLGGTGSIGGALDTQLFATATGSLYVQVAVGPTPLAPRLRLGTVPQAAFALEADNAHKLDGKTLEELKQVFSGKEALDALKVAGTINAPGNPVDWSQLKNVPPTIVAGVPPVTGTATLSGQGTPDSPLAVVYGDTAGTAAVGNDPRFAKITQLQNQLDALSASLASTYATQAALTAGLANTVKAEATGGVRFSADSSTCNSSTAGTIRFQNGNFQGCTGSNWANLNNVPPSIDTVTPPGGPLSGGYLITIRGASFVPPMSVLIGGVACTNVTVVSPSVLTATVPPSSAAAAKDLRLENSDGSFATRAGGFTYTPTTFDLTGSSQTFLVPLGVTSLNVDVSGAAGARSPNNSASGAAGGLGGRVQATIPVTPGETLLVYVGGQGVGSNAGGFNGGGQGGKNPSYNVGGQGGGGSDIRRTTALADRLVVAGGGGGGGYDSIPSVGGAGGGTTGADGTCHSCGSAYGASGGRGGTPSAGGSPGVYSGYTNSGPGALGQGGAGVASGSSADNSGGGGGGGYYGGGAGTWGGGGGGSSFVIPSATNVVHTQGYRSGNGQIVISFP